MADTDETGQALAQLKAAATQYRASEAAHENARMEAITAVVAALKAGASPTLVADTSPFTSAYVRKIARENDIQPAKPGVKKSDVSGLRVPPAKPPTMRAK